MLFSWEMNNCEGMKASTIKSVTIGMIMTAWTNTADFNYISHAELKTSLLLSPKKSKSSCIILNWETFFRFLETLLSATDKYLTHVSDCNLFIAPNDTWGKMGLHFIFCKRKGEVNLKEQLWSQLFTMQKFVRLIFLGGKKIYVRLFFKQIS